MESFVGYCKDFGFLGKMGSYGKISSRSMMGATEEL